MKLILSVVLAIGSVVSAHAQSDPLYVAASRFETAAAETIGAEAPHDPFSETAACAVLSEVAIRAWTLEEAAQRVEPCLMAVSRRYSVAMRIDSGLIISSQNGEKRGALFLKTELLPGSSAHRDIAAALSRRGGRLLGHPVRLLTRGEEMGTPVSAVQEALSSCVMTTVVKDLRTGEDFIRIYGNCLKRSSELRISDLRPAQGLMVTVTAAPDGERFSSLSGSVTVNVGHGPIRVLIIAVSSSADSR